MSAYSVVCRSRLIKISVIFKPYLYKKVWFFYFMKIIFQSLVKEFKVRSLASLDKGYELKLQSEDHAMGELIKAPSDRQVKVTIEWGEDD